MRQSPKILHITREYAEKMEGQEKLLKVKEMTKKDRVLQTIRARGRMKTSDVIKFGSQIFSNRAERDARQLVQDGLLWRMREDLKVKYYGNIKEDVFTADQGES